MPTNNNIDPPSPPQFQSFSTCPEDSVSIAPWSPASSSWHQPDQDRSVDVDGPETVMADPEISPAVSPSLPDTAPIADGILDDEPQSGLSSRSITTSPRPQTGDTAQSTPSATTMDLDSSKQTDTEEDGRSSTDNMPDSRFVLGHSTFRHSRHLRHGGSSISESEKSLDGGSLGWWGDEYSATSMGLDYSSMRMIATSPSSFLRPGSRFHGTQQSERQVYDVQVEIKHVDLRESFLCGYLRIQGLTEDHPTLTTYFEGEIIGTKYGFITEHENWGATDKIDINHWAKFHAFRPYQKQARKGPIVIRDVAQRDHIFMRWKEHFLVPDHRVRTITGASFEGFYYICFNQIKGEVSGIYFHSKSEKFQQLELKHIPDRGCFSAIEFR